MSASPLPTIKTAVGLFHPPIGRKITEPIYLRVPWGREHVLALDPLLDGIDRCVLAGTI